MLPAMTELIALSGVYLSERRGPLSGWSDQELMWDASKIILQARLWARQNVSVEGCFSAFGIRHHGLRQGGPDHF